MLVKTLFQPKNMRKLSGPLSLCFTMETVSFFPLTITDSLLFHLEVYFSLIALKLGWKPPTVLLLLFYAVGRFSKLFFLRISLYLYLSIHLSLLSFVSIWFLMHCVPEQICVIYQIPTNASFLSSEAQLSCN